MRDELLTLIPPVGSVWSDEPFAPERDFSQTVVWANARRVDYRSGSGDFASVPRLSFFGMFPWRHKEFEEVDA